MPEWVYKATSSKVDVVRTTMLAEVRGFICRSAYEGPEKWVRTVRKVLVGHTIHMYFVRPGKVDPIGSFEVVEPSKHPRGASFGNVVTGTSLCEVVGESLITLLESMKGYDVDPVVKKFTGWPVVKTSPAPTYSPSMFPPRATLHRYP